MFTCKENKNFLDGLDNYLFLLSSPDEIQAITNIIEKQAQIVVKPKEVLKEDTLQKAALLAQYAEVTDDEEYPFCTVNSESVYSLAG